jgi:hypothetical protein
MTFDKIVNQASERREIGFEQLLARMDRSMSEVEQATAPYLLAYNFSEDAPGRPICGLPQKSPFVLRRFVPHAVFGILDPAAFGRKSR